MWMTTMIYSMAILSTTQSDITPTQERWYVLVCGPQRTCISVAMKNVPGHDVLASVPSFLCICRLVSVSRVFRRSLIADEKGKTPAEKQHETRWKEGESIGAAAAYGVSGAVTMSNTTMTQHKTPSIKRTGATPKKQTTKPQMYVHTIFLCSFIPDCW